MAAYHAALAGDVPQVGASRYAGGTVNAAVRATRVTRIIVAHRWETIRSTDRAIVLDHGKVVRDCPMPSGDLASATFSETSRLEGLLTHS